MQNCACFYAIFYRRLLFCWKTDDVLAVRNILKIRVFFLLLWVLSLLPSVVVVQWVPLFSSPLSPHFRSFFFPFCFIVQTFSLAWIFCSSLSKWLCILLSNIRAHLSYLSQMNLLLLFYDVHPGQDLVLSARIINSDVGCIWARCREPWVDHSILLRPPPGKTARWKWDTEFPSTSTISRTLTFSIYGKREWFWRFYLLLVFFPINNSWDFLCCFLSVAIWTCFMRSARQWLSQKKSVKQRRREAQLFV